MSAVELSGPNLPAFVNSLEYGFTPRRFTERHTRTYGPTFLAKSRLGDAIFTAHPEHVRRIFAADSDVFKTFAAAALKPFFGARSVLLTSGKVHKAQRKLLAPPLTGARLRAFGASMQAIADRHVAALRPGQQLRTIHFTTAFTLEVIVRTVFGAQTELEVNEVSTLLHRLTSGITPLTFFAPGLQRSWFPPWARYLAASAEFRGWLGGQIVRRRREGDSRDDVLSLLLETRFDDGTPIDDDEIHDQLVTLLLAGHETTAVALANCVGNVLRNPPVLQRLLGELAGAGQAPEDLQRLPYLSAVIDETLRVDPIVTDVARIPRSDFALDDKLTVTPKQVLLVLIEGLHQDPTLYPEPACFRPERFLERKFLPHEFAPFGGGVRRCLGAAFSDYENKILLATLLRRTSLSLTRQGPEPRVRRNITMGPKFGVPVRVEALR